MQAGQTASRALWLVTISLAWPVLAERLPIRTYTTADGLPGQTVNCIVRDSSSFLWLCTWDGLVQYDGYTFTNFGLDTGIPHRHVTAFLETHDGSYWVGTYNGVAQFRPEIARSGKSPFIRYSLPGPETAQHVTSLVEGRDGAIWCGTHNGVLTKPPGSGFHEVDLGLPATSWTSRFVQALAIDRDGAVWIGTEGSGLIRRTPDGIVERYQLASKSVPSVLADGDGRLWAGTYQGLCLLTRHPGDSKWRIDRVYSSADGLPNLRIRALTRTGDGRIWVGTEQGVAVLSQGSEVFQAIGARQGLKDVLIHSLGSDFEANVWIAAESCLMRLSVSGFVTYDAADGLGGNQVVSIFEDREGQLYAVNGIRRLVINRLDGSHFTAVEPLLIRGKKRIAYMGWGVGQTVLRNRAGDWWVPTGEGLCRYSGIRRLEDLAHVAPVVYTRTDGLPGNDIFRLYEDRHNDLWVATVDTPALSRWQPQAGRFERVQESEGYRTSNPPAAMAEDRAGNLWVGLFWNGLARLRHGRWHMFTAADGIPGGSLWSMVVDPRGRLWIASSSDGLARVDDPDAEVPRFIRYSTRQGLSSDLLRSLSADRQGFIYAATDRGVDVVDPEMSYIQSFGPLDGVASGDLFAAFCDRSGTAWFGAASGLSRLRREARGPGKPPRVRITRLRIAGVPRPLSALGETDVSGMVLNPDQNHVEIGFGSSGFRPGATVRFQSRLLGSGSDWNEATEARTVNLAGLGAGSYRFEVRAVSEGLGSSTAAGVSFEILAPVWRRWWAISAAILFTIALLFAAHRYRVAQLVEMEKVRTRIALDLHDDIGSSLSQISVLSEVALRQAGPNAAAAQSLTRVAEISRDLVNALGDIVWAVNPKRDRVADMVHRMRRFGEDLLNSRNIEFDFSTPDAILDMELGAEFRRQMFLVFKEGIHNIARHSHCRHAKAELTAQDGRLSLYLTDDGEGFGRDPLKSDDAHGLASMKKRAEELGGTLQVNSEKGVGTTIRLTAPVRSTYLIRW